MAEFERSIIRERTKAGLDAARARGRTGGRPPALSAKDVAAAKAMLSDPGITSERGGAPNEGGAVHPLSPSPRRSQRVRSTMAPLVKHERYGRCVSTDLGVQL